MNQEETEAILPQDNPTETEPQEQPDKKQADDAAHQGEVVQMPAKNEVIDPVKVLSEASDPIPLLAVIDLINLADKNEDGVPIFNMLCNKFLPLANILQDKKFEMLTDSQGRSPLHYAVAVDDVKAAYECLKRGAKNEPDSQGYTPVMEAVKYGHRRCFLLCIHFQHLSEGLPQVAAKYNRIWELKILQSFGFDLQARDEHSMTPLDVAVQNYSYEAAEYLAKISPQANTFSLRSLTDSEAIIRRVERAKKQASLGHRLIPLVSRSISLLFILLATQRLDCFEASRSSRLYEVLIALGILLLSIGVSWISCHSKKASESLLVLLKEPYFPVLGQICPSCIAFKETGYDHCDICHTCIPKFHQHKAFCINRSNELLWYGHQFFWAWLLGSLLNQVMGWRRLMTLTLAPTGYVDFMGFCVSVDYFIQNGDTVSALVLVVLLVVWVQQCLFCMQLVGMAFMNRTYQQVTHSEDYPELYEPFKSKEGKIKLKEQRIFLKWKLLGGLCVGIKNILLYFL